MFIDAMTREQAWRLIYFIGDGQSPRRAAAALFPDKPKGYVKATALLRDYAYAKASAHNSELLIETRREYSVLCARIWCDMPSYAHYIDWRVVG